MRPRGTRTLARIGACLLLLGLGAMTNSDGRWVIVGVCVGAIFECQLWVATTPKDVRDDA